MLSAMVLKINDSFGKTTAKVIPIAIIATTTLTGRPRK
jgi:hypothetical protein